MKNPLLKGGCQDNKVPPTDPRILSYEPKPLNVLDSPLTSNGYPQPTYGIPSPVLAADINGDLKQDYLVYAAKSGSSFSV